ncbi:MAG TPA: AI-2E family transporter [Gemmatimonadaceae bacterium]
MTPPTPIRSSDTFRVAAALFGIYLVAQLLWLANALVLAAFLGVLFGLAVDAGVTPLQRFRIPRSLSAVAIVLLFMLLLVGVGAALAPAISEQTAEVKTRVPEAAERLTQWLNTHGLRIVPAASDSAGRAQAAQSMRDNLTNLASRVTPYVFPFLSQTVAVIGGLFLIVFLAIYIGANPEQHRRGVMLLFPQHARARAGEVLTAMATVLRKWLVTQLIAMVVISVVSMVVLSILQVKAAFALGLLAGVLEFVPTLGPLMSALPAIAMAFLDSPEKALAVTLAYIGIQFVENNVLIPLLMKGGVDVPPVLTIIGQALLTLLFGFLGLMVAVPLLAATLVAYKMLFIEPEPVLVIADSMPASPTPPEESAG